jgi:hypothetical protein
MKINNAYRIGWLAIKEGKIMNEFVTPENMEKIQAQENFVETYQCPGCVCGSDFKCFESGDGIECGKHIPGTMGYPTIGRFFLGLVTGFNRLGPVNDMRIKCYENPSDGWCFDKFNVPVWKYLDENGNTIIRGLSPRTNNPFLHIFLGDFINEIDCLEITKDDLDEMD